MTTVLFSLFSGIKLLNTNTIMTHFYAVAKGRKTGIFHTWPECQEQVVKFKGARYKKFDSKEAAEEFIKLHGESQNNR